MQLSYLLTAFLAGLASAGPIVGRSTGPADRRAANADKALLASRQGGDSDGTGSSSELSPVPSSDEIEEQDDIDDEDQDLAMTDAYLRVAALTDELEEGDWFAFKQTLRPDSYYDSAPAEMQELIDDLGFQHAWIVVGTVVVNDDDELDFQAQMYDLKMTDPFQMDSPTYIDTKDWRPPQSSDLEYLGKVDDDDADQIADYIAEYEGDEDDEDNQHAEFSVDDNNCATFVDWMADKLDVD
ncbi:hypothetical protein GGR56DRAFT_652574 [Xylariaceae sp. FL0804]|nr:hypothetical protein GGR56DRAFT_652574 [Xylariaceae sp. FL0804]